MREVAPVLQPSVPSEVELFPEKVAEELDRMSELVQRVTGSDCAAASDQTLTAAAGCDRQEDGTFAAAGGERNPCLLLCDRIPGHRIAVPDAADSMADAAAPTADKHEAGNHLHEGVAVVEEQICCTRCQHLDDWDIGLVVRGTWDHESRCIAGHTRTEGTDMRESEEQMRSEEKQHRDYSDSPSPEHETRDDRHAAVHVLHAVHSHTHTN